MGGEGAAGGLSASHAATAGLLTCPTEAASSMPGEAQVGCRRNGRSWPYVVFWTVDLEALHTLVGGVGPGSQIEGVSLT